MIRLGVNIDHVATIRNKEYNTTLWISLNDKPGVLGEVTSLIGHNNL